MRTDFWRNGAAAILAVGLLAVAAVAQTGEASSEVKIEGDKPAAASSAEARPTVKPAKPVITDRDPFVNQVDAGVVTGGSAPRRTVRSSGSAPSVRPAASGGVSAAKASAKGMPAAEEVEPEVIVPAPEVTITGIVKSGSGNQAIVTSNSGSYIVRAGQKLGDYRVSAITDTAVTFTHTGKSFKIPIDSQFGLGKK